MPLTVPNLSVLNLTPTSTEVVSPESVVDGVWLPHSEHEHETLTVVPLDALPRLALSSTARTLIVVEGLPWTCQV